LSVFFLLFRIIPHWRLAWFFIICSIEAIPISASLRWSMSHFGKRHGHPKPAGSDR
jgi:hypothetical protein